MGGIGGEVWYLPPVLSLRGARRRGNPHLLPVRHVSQRKRTDSHIGAAPLLGMTERNYQFLIEVSFPVEFAAPGAAEHIRVAVHADDLFRLQGDDLFGGIAVLRQHRFRVGAHAPGWFRVRRAGPKLHRAAHQAHIRAAVIIVDALEQIRRKDTRVMAAIATTSQDFALESYRLRAARYLEKPVKEDDIRDLIQDVIHKKESEPHFEGESGGKRIRVPFDCILFAEQRGKNICLHMDDGEELVFRGKLDDEINKFPEKYFFRCHKSFLVNLSKICGIDRELLTFVMQGGEQVHIHRQGFFAAKRAYEHYLFSIAEGRKQEGQGADE